MTLARGVTEWIDGLIGKGRDLIEGVRVEADGLRPGHDQGEEH